MPRERQGNRPFISFVSFSVSLSSLVFSFIALKRFCLFPTLIGVVSLGSSYDGNCLCDLSSRPSDDNEL